MINYGNFSEVPKCTKSNAAILNQKYHSGNLVFLFFSFADMCRQRQISHYNSRKLLLLQLFSAKVIAFGRCDSHVSLHRLILLSAVAKENGTPVSSTVI